MKLKKLLTKTLLVAVCLLVGGGNFAWAATYKVKYNGSDSGNTSYFTNSSKHNFNAKFTGCTYDGTSFTSGLKMEGETTISFTNTNTATVTIVQSTWSDKTIKFDGTELTVGDAETITGGRVYTISNVAAGNHTVARGSGESGLFQITVIEASATKPGAISFSPTAGSVAEGSSVTLTSTDATTIVYQWGASAVGEGGNWSSATTYSGSSKPVVPTAGSENTVLSVKASNANGDTYGSASYTPVKMALKTIYSFADGIGGQAVEVADASVETSQMSLKNTNGRIKLTAATGFKFENGDEIEFSGSVGNTERPYGIKYGPSTDLGTDSYVAAGQPCHVSGTLTLASGTSDLYIGRYGGTTTNFTTFTIRQLTAATSVAFNGVKLNGSDAVEYEDYTMEGTVITLTAAYTEAPSVYLVNHIVFADESIEDQNVLVSFGNPDGTYFTGTAVIDGTTYTVKAPCGQINALKVVYKYSDTTVKEELLDVTGLKVGASYTVPFRMYVEKDGALYQTTKNSSNPWYGDAVTLAYNTTVTKSVSSVDLGGGTLVLFEDFDGDVDNNANIRASNCSAYNNTAYTSENNLTAGKYTFIVKAMNKGRGSSIAVGSTTVAGIADIVNKDSWGDKTFTDVIVPVDGKLTLVKGGSNTIDYYDIIIAIRTGDATVSGTITPAGWSTFASSYPLNLSTISGGTAYYASSANGSTVTLKPTTATVPAGEGLMIQGTQNATFTIGVAASGTAIDGNLLKGQTNTGNVAASTTGKYHYVFGYKTSDATEFGFYNLKDDTEVAAGKAYLETTTALGRALRIVFGDEASGINDMKREATSNNRFYNLSGQEVAQPTKGLYIVNGKKVIIK